MSCYETTALTFGQYIKCGWADYITIIAMVAVAGALIVWMDRK